jgi:uncharacterized protein (DUF1697 family)
LGSVVVAATVVGWFAMRGDDGGGPLQDGFDGDYYEVCGPSRPGGRFSFGDDVTNTFDTELVLSLWVPGSRSVGRRGERGLVRYVALLRGIAPMNPNMRNDRLRGVFENLGFGDVQTVVSSGNIVFETETRDVESLEARIEEAWPEQLEFQSTTIVRTRQQMDELVAGNPFGDRPDAPASSLQVTFLKHDSDVNLYLPFTADAGDYTIVALEDRVVCSVVDLTTSRTPDLMRSLEKMFGREITTRTWRTVHRIVRKL